MLLMEDKTSNGDSPEIFKIDNHEDDEGRVGVTGEYYLEVFGTWDGATVTAHYSTDGSNWSDADAEGTYTENKGIWMTIPKGVGQVKVTVSSAGGSTSLSARILSKNAFT